MHSVKYVYFVLSSSYTFMRTSAAHMPDRTLRKEYPLSLHWFAHLRRADRNVPSLPMVPQFPHNMKHVTSILFMREMTTEFLLLALKGKGYCQQCSLKDTQENKELTS